MQIDILNKEYYNIIISFSFNLNINNIIYEELILILTIIKQDLEEMLSLSNPYTNQELFNKVKIVETESLKNNPETKKEFVEFLSDVTAKLKRV